ncbi:MAG: zinc dependent phospholipase C family protein [Bacillota bacterium]|nr:zinc dependent phospholipase C family protein [Bacillota bacterium]
MSDLLNHYYCGELVLEKLNYGPKNIVNLNRGLFDLGCQGPDFFLYNGVSPWKKDKGIQKYGGLIHISPTSQLFFIMAEYIKGLKNEELKKKYLSYLFGYVCHHTLDSITHPFIFYYSGVKNEEDPDTYIYPHYHKKFEMYLDVFMTKKLEKKGPLEFPMGEIFTLNNIDRDIVYTINKKILKELFHIDLKKSDVYDSLKEAASLLKLFPDKKGVKFKVFSFIEKIIRKPYIITKAIITKDIQDTEDYMNLEHNTWIHPCDLNEKRHESYPDLFFRAVDEANIKLNQLYELLYNEKLTKEEIHKLFKNISFETGKTVSPEINESQRMINFEIKKI